MPQAAEDGRRQLRTATQNEKSTPAET